MPRVPKPLLDDPRDLAEFILYWDEFRGDAEDALHVLHGESRQAMVLRWLIRLADRVGPHDIGSSEPCRGVDMPRGSHWP